MFSWWLSVREKGSLWYLEFKSAQYVLFCAERYTSKRQAVVPEDVGQDVHALCKCEARWFLRRHGLDARHQCREWRIVPGAAELRASQRRSLVDSGHRFA